MRCKERQKKTCCTFSNSLLLGKQVDFQSQDHSDCDWGSYNIKSTLSNANGVCSFHTTDIHWIPHSSRSLLMSCRFCIAVETGKSIPRRVHDLGAQLLHCPPSLRWVYIKTVSPINRHSLQHMLLYRFVGITFLLLS